MKQEKKDIGSFRFEELKEEMTSIGEKAFRAKQVYEWLHVKLVRSFDEMTNLSKPLREKLARQYEIREVEMLDRQVSAMDGTNKFLFRLSDGHVVESVLMKYKHGNSVCISSQVGCRMGCRFCASTIGGLERNLTPSEMLGQIYQIQRISGERVANVVVMGTGEPLDNYENLLKFIQMLTDEHGLHISQRNVTVSTCGIVPKMLELAEEHLQITLALSLHGSTQEKRKKLMPVANKYELSEVLEACDIYFAKTGRRMTFEYSLVHGVNDTEEDAKELSALLNAMDYNAELPKTILYCLNAKDNEMLASMAGNFQDGSCKGKVQFGAAWWFLDQKRGMEAQLDVLSQIGLLSAFVGMLTDSRSFLSFPRHEYFRRILCNYIGTLVENGEYPADMEFLGQMVENICYNNAMEYFGF